MTQTTDTPALILRQLTPDDLESIVALQLACFPDMKPWSRVHLESMCSIFPEGQLCIERDGKLVASCCSLVVDASDYPDWHDWREISDNGMIRNHDPEGDTLYGIELQVHPEARGMKLARRLYDARKDLCRQLHLSRMAIGGRIPGYAKWKDQLTAREYVERVIRKELFDPVLTTQISNGFTLQRLVPDYLPSDEDSAGYATSMEWSNLDYVPARSRRERRATWPVRVAAVQYQMCKIGSWQDFVDHVEAQVDTASDYRADFVLFPELFTLQLLSLVPPDRPGAAARRLAEFTPAFLELMSGLAVRYNINIIGGSQFTLDGDTLYNSAYLFHRDGRMDRQDKLHITPAEKQWWGIAGGKGLEVFETDRGKVAILVCYDVEFPELTRIASTRGAGILFVPFNTNDRNGCLRVRICSQARCVENQIFVAAAGCVGHLSGVENADLHYAASAVFTPIDLSFGRDGIACEASPEVETLLVHDVDLELLRRARRVGTVRPWQDRRPDLYRLVSLDRDPPEEV
jgi:predicted amidohydrolase/ribosomal protein S18 acetylase RimI-like enzyme